MGRLTLSGSFRFAMRCRPLGPGGGSGKKHPAAARSPSRSPRPCVACSWIAVYRWAAATLLWRIRLLTLLTFYDRADTDYPNQG